MSRLKHGEKHSNALNNLKVTKQTEELEKSVQKELEKAGLGDGGL